MIFFFFPVYFGKLATCLTAAPVFRPLGFFRIFSELPSMAYCPALVFQYLVAGRKEGLAYLRLREEITR